MISKYTYKKLTWVDLESPTKEEVQNLASEYSLPSLVAEELQNPTFRSKVDRYDNFVYLVLHFPVINKNDKRQFEQEVDFIIGKEFVFTTHYESVDALNEFSKLFEINSSLDRGITGNHAGFLFFSIIQEMYRHVLVELDTMDDALRDIERSIFEGRENEMVSVISNTNRTFIDFKQAIRFHGETLASFERVGTEFFGADFTYYLNAVTGEYRKVQKVIEDHAEILRDLRETNDSLLTAKTNDIITKLTIVNFIILPLGLITWVFGMTSEVIFIKDVTDFFLVITAMVLTGLVLFIYFKGKKWL